MKRLRVELLGKRPDGGFVHPAGSAHPSLTRHQVLQIQELRIQRCVGRHGVPSGGNHHVPAGRRRGSPRLCPKLRLTLRRKPGAPRKIGQILEETLCGAAGERTSRTGIELSAQDAQLRSAV